MWHGCLLWCHHEPHGAFIILRTLIVARLCRSPSWSSPFSTPVCPSSLSKALISSRKKRVASEASLSTMSLPTSPKLAVSGRTRRGLDLANLADALIVDRLRTAILDGLKERQADGVHTNLALSGGIYRRPVSFSVNDMLAKVGLLNNYVSESLLSRS